MRCSALIGTFYCPYFSKFQQTMASFKKPLVACVKGEISGLGTRILPLFDIVWAHSHSTFIPKDEMLGEILEGSAIISTTDKISCNAVSIH